MFAAHSGHTPAVRVLAELCSDLNALDTSGEPRPCRAFPSALSAWLDPAVIVGKVWPAQGLGCGKHHPLWVPACMQSLPCTAAPCTSLPSTAAPCLALTGYTALMICTFCDRAAAAEAIINAGAEVCGVRSCWHQNPCILPAKRVEEVPLRRSPR